MQEKNQQLKISFSLLSKEKEKMLLDNNKEKVYQMKKEKKGRSKENNKKLNKNN